MIAPDKSPSQKSGEFGPRPMWCDGFDFDLPKVVPEARDIVGDLADVVLWTSSHSAEGALNHPNVWNGHGEMVAFFGFSGVRRPPVYLCTGDAVRCTAWEAVRDAWPHHYTIYVEQQPIWDTLDLFPQFETILVHVRGWPSRGDDPEAARAVVRASLEQAIGRLRVLVEAHGLDVHRWAGPDELGAGVTAGAA